MKVEWKADSMESQTAEVMESCSVVQKVVDLVLKMVELKAASKVYLRVEMMVESKVDWKVDSMESQTADVMESYSVVMKVVYSEELWVVGWGIW
jgi:hypothetical protein